MSKFGIIPPEPPVIASLDGLAPRFSAAVRQVVETMHARNRDAVVRESLRTDERQQWLEGFGRRYDDGRGIVTNAKTGRTSWHFYGLAVDIVSASKGDEAQPPFWLDLYDVARLFSLTRGIDFRSAAGLYDKPHVQWGNGMRYSPSPHAYALYLTGGRQAVWKAVGALA